MLIQFVVAGIVSVCNIAIHALVMTALVRIAHAVTGTTNRHPSVFLTGAMIATVSVLMIAHAAEVMVWALTYALLDVAPAGTNFVYFAFVNYTTLGYGDVVPTREWQLLGPITAMNGILLFGWSTAVIFEVLRKTMALSVTPADQLRPRV